MKKKILAYLRDFPLQPTQNICAGIGGKRSSVSKCLTRLFETQQVSRKYVGKFVLYTLPEFPVCNETEKP